MPTPRSLGSLLGLVLLVLSPAVPAQVEHGGAPPSLRRSLRQPVPTARMRAVERERLLAEDAAQGGKGPVRFADVLEVELGLRDAGVWEELPGGDRVWRLRVESRGAFSLAFVFRRFQLPEGGELYLYDDARTLVRGAYTELENRLDGEFAIQPTPGEALTLEYYEPARARGRGELELALVVHDYRDVLGVAQDRNGGGGGAGACNIDVACPEGAPWQDQIRAAVHIMTLPAGLCCSGSLVNNTANDGTALVLSAAHCGSLTNAVFLFNYQRPACGSGPAPSTDTVLGSTELVADATLDFRLVRLNQPIPPAYGVFLAGWDRSDSIPASVVTIHHPGGDVKKISLENDPPAKDGSSWRILGWDAGVTEGGSSGSPLYSPEGRFIGQLDRGASDCANPDADDFYGRLAAQWELVEPYLDPVGTGQLTLDGLDPSTLPTPSFELTGVYPASVETLIPGTRKVVRVLGSGFEDGFGIAIDGMQLPAGTYVRGGNGFINVDTPPLDVGTHTVFVRQGGVTMSVPFQVVAPATPRYQAVNGDPGDIVVSFAGIDLFYAGPPGSVHYFFYSLSNVPSVHPVLTLLLGNNFTQVRHCGIVTIPLRGWTMGHMPIRPGVFAPETTVYSQTACVNCGVPFPASNLQQSLFLF